MENAEGLILFLVIIGLFAALIYWQYRICKGKNGKKLGLILPLVSLALAVLTAVSFWAFSAVKSTGYSEAVYDDDGNLVQEEVIVDTEVDSSMDTWIGVIVTLLVCNIPTAIYFGEYAAVACRTQQEEIARTEIQDL